MRSHAPIASIGHLIRSPNRCRHQGEPLSIREIGTRAPGRAPDIRCTPRFDTTRCCGSQRPAHPNARIHPRTVWDPYDRTRADTTGHSLHATVRHDAMLRIATSSPPQRTHPPPDGLRLVRPGTRRHRRTFVVRHSPARRGCCGSRSPAHPSARIHPGTVRDACDRARADTAGHSLSVMGGRDAVQRVATSSPPQRTHSFPDGLGLARPDARRHRRTFVVRHGPARRGCCESRSPACPSARDYPRTIRLRGCDRDRRCTCGVTAARPGVPEPAVRNRGT